MCRWCLDQQLEIESQVLVIHAQFCVRIGTGYGVVAAASGGMSTDGLRATIRVGHSDIDDLGNQKLLHLPERLVLFVRNLFRFVLRHCYFRRSKSSRNCLWENDEIADLALVAHQRT